MKKRKEPFLMSRSYKKTPRAGDTKNKFLKHYANKQLRKKDFDTDLSHNNYKKFSESWNICDFEVVGTDFSDYWRNVVRQWHSWKYRYDSFPDKKQAYKEWYKHFRRK
jgi:hypothetical protein